MSAYVMVDENNLVTNGPFLWDGVAELTPPPGQRILLASDPEIFWPAPEVSKVALMAYPDDLEQAHAAVQGATDLDTLKNALAQFIAAVK